MRGRGRGGDLPGIGILASGGGSNLQAIIDAIASGGLPGFAIRIVIADRPCAALDRARTAGIATALINRKKYIPNSEEFSDAVLAELEARDGPADGQTNGIGLVVLAGFLSILKGVILSRLAGHIVNIHPSLIPSFCGEGCHGIHVHEMALARGVKVTGATVHLVDGRIDGGRILLQEPVRVDGADTALTLQARVLEVEHRLIVEGVRLFADLEVTC